MSKINLLALIFTIFVPLSAMQEGPIDVVKELRVWQGEVFSQKIKEILQKHHFPQKNLNNWLKDTFSLVEKNDKSKDLFDLWYEMPEQVAGTGMDISNLKKTLSSTGIETEVLLVLEQTLEAEIKERQEKAQAYLRKEAKKLYELIKLYVKEEEERAKCGKKNFIVSAELFLENENIDPMSLGVTPFLMDITKIDLWERLYGGTFYKKPCLQIKKEHGFHLDRCFVNRIRDDIIGCQLPVSGQWKRFDCASRAVVAYLTLKLCICISIAIKILTSEYFEKIVERVNKIIEKSREMIYGKDIEHGDWGDGVEVSILAGNLQEEYYNSNRIVSIELHPGSKHWIVFCAEYMPKYNMHVAFLVDSFSLGKVYDEVVIVDKEPFKFPRACFVRDRFMRYGDFLCHQIDGAVKRKVLRGRRPNG